MAPLAIEKDTQSWVLQKVRLAIEKDTQSRVLQKASLVIGKVTQSWVLQKAQLAIGKVKSRQELCFCVVPFFKDIEILNLF